MVSGLVVHRLTVERITFDRERVLAGVRSERGDSLEDLLIALIERLETGARDAELERAILDRVAAGSRRARWDIDVRLAAIWDAAVVSARPHDPER